MAIKKTLDAKKIEKQILLSVYLLIFFKILFNNKTSLVVEKGTLKLFFSAPVLNMHCWWLHCWKRHMTHVGILSCYVSYVKDALIWWLYIVTFKWVLRTALASKKIVFSPFFTIFTGIASFWFILMQKGGRWKIS